MRQRGFTIVELLIVMIVIAILATITTVSYTSIQAQARDAEVRDGASKIADAIELLYVNHQLTPRQTQSNEGTDGGLIFQDGKIVCTDDNGDATGTGFIAKNIYPCSIVEILVMYRLIEDGYVESMPPNTHFPTQTNGARSYMTYSCTATDAEGDAVLLYSLERPSQDDESNYDRAVADCGAGASARNDSGMQGAVYLDIL